MNFDVTHNFLRRVDFEPLIYSRYKGTLFRPNAYGTASFKTKKATRWSPFLLANSLELQGETVLKGDCPAKRGRRPLI
jgi:hypothetical protein